MKNILLVTMVMATTLVFAQTNLVENPHFKQTEKGKLKEGGMIEMASPWVSPTLAKSDLYVPGAKTFLANVPDNEYGEEKPMEGEGYAGVLAYSYKDKMPRTYLQGKLSQKLEAGKEYCVTFHVSLADLSKYACNYIGIALSDKAITANNSDLLSFDNAIVSKRLTVYEQQFYWTPICGVYKAKGGEEYLTIGNFTPSEKLTTKKIKRPRGFTKPQKYDAYYYIDNVSVVAKEEVDKCNCDVIPGMENAKTVERDFTSEKSVQSKNVKIINTDGTTAGSATKANSKTANQSFNLDEILMLNFDPKSFVMTEEGTKKLDALVNFLKENKEIKISVIGYVDESESDVSKLDGRRVGTVYKYIVSQGVSKERIERNMGGVSPVDEKDKLKNMRVEIEQVIE